jgi:hypothetical protein
MSHETVKATSKIPLHSTPPSKIYVDGTYQGYGWRLWKEGNEWFHLGGQGKKTPDGYHSPSIYKWIYDTAKTRWRWSKRNVDQSSAGSLWSLYGTLP